MQILTSEQIRLLEERSEKYGVSKDVLMRNEGIAASNFIKNKVLNLKKKNCIILCGIDHNGGDGYCLACRLHDEGYQVKVIAIEKKIENQLVKNAKNRAEANGVTILTGKNINLIKENMQDADVLVDAIWGINFNKDIDDEIQALHILWQQNKAIKIALDIPTGIEADNGQVYKYCFESDYTIAFNSFKLSHVMSPAREKSGEIEVVDIGIPVAAKETIRANNFFIDKKIVFNNIRPRNVYTNKGDYGKLLNISGSREMTGAAILSTLGALRVGTGIVTLGSTEKVIDRVASSLVEAKFETFKSTNRKNISMLALDDILEAVSKADVCLLVCGLGRNRDIIEIVNKVISTAECPLIIDADGINAIADNVNILKMKRNKIILTPHIGEMARLLRVSISEVINFKYDVISKFACEYNVTVVLKDYNTIIVDEKGDTYVNIHENPGLSKGGSGDILAGMIAGLMSQGIDNAAVCGVYLHYKAAAMCAQRKSQYGMLPSDILEDLCNIFVENRR